jgi:uncharacterized protein (DUF1501 family)
MDFTRRQFFQCTGASLAMAAMSPNMRFLPGTNVAYAQGPTDAIVVFVQLFGGNDSLNTCYPLGGNQRTLYEEYRPTLKLPDMTPDLAPWISAGFGNSEILSVGTNDDGEEYALHPAMSALHDLYEQGNMAVVHGVHYPFPDHSHFRSSEIWYTANPQGTDGQGWFGDFLNNSGLAATDVPGVIMGRSNNPLFTPTNVGLLSFRSLSELRYPSAGEEALKRDIIRNLYTASSGSGVEFPELEKIGQTGVATLDTISQYYQSGNGIDNAGKVEALLLDANERYRRNNSLVYDSPLNFDENENLARESLVVDLRHVAATIRSNVNARFFHVGISGFDSHSNQEAGFFHTNLLTELSEAIAAFYKDISQSVTLPQGYDDYATGSLADRVVVVTLSEFGRTMRQNSQSASTAGTDHAASSCQFVVGNPVIGGQYGAHPQLDNPGFARKNDMRMTNDFRDYFGTILNRWLNVPTADLGPGPGKILPATDVADADGNDYTAFTPLDFLTA